MSFWSRMLGRGDNVTPNDNGPADYNPGDAEGLEILGEPVEARALPFPVPSPWSGWPQTWGVPNWSTQNGLNKLIDTAWNCLDLNSSALASMPVYRTKSGKISDPLGWMTNPDPDIYASWDEFAKQLFWDYQMGEVFVLPMARGADGYPIRFRVIPPWLMNVELKGGRREYTLGGEDVTSDILHIRYQGSTTDARGHGPLEAAMPRMATAGLLQRYVQTLAETGGTPLYWLGVGRRLNQAEADDLLNAWVESRKRHAGEPALVSGGAELHQAQSMSARDMTLLEIEQFNESRIAVALGVPPFLAGLPSGGDSMTYSNVSQLFDFHDRSSLRPKAKAVMAALSNWVLPRGQAVELNRDEYSRPALKERAESYKTLHDIVDTDGRPAITVQEVRTMERLHGDDGERAPSAAALSLSGGDNA
ncbi:portal protein [Mycobacterium phage prophiGD91-2]|uniref:phage portal protein n=1 Tax=Mycobacteroides abscessus TaxID=36809 RepID=UPI0019D09020|nr:phage portal protein [Mycobacteroides abscessus]QSM03938.1 portal protein [Mycobacterium phage prophiGD91-2]